MGWGGGGGGPYRRGAEGGRGRPLPRRGCLLFPTEAGRLPCAPLASAARRSLTALVRAAAPLSSESPRPSPLPRQPSPPPPPPSTLTLSQAAGPRPPSPPPAPPPASHLLLPRLLLQQGPSCWSASSSSSSSSAPSLVVLVPFLFLGLRPAPETGAGKRARPLLRGGGARGGEGRREGGDGRGGAGRAREESSESPAANAREGGPRRSPSTPGAHPHPEPPNWSSSRRPSPTSASAPSGEWPDRRRGRIGKFLTFPSNPALARP